MLGSLSRRLQNELPHIRQSRLTAACRSIIALACEKILERAKGLEPSTPTLARSCSTTELHPHPRCRRSLAGNGRAMPNAGRECNSAKTAKRHRNHPDRPIFLTNRRESLRNDAQTAIIGCPVPKAGILGRIGWHRGGDSGVRPGAPLPVNSPRWRDLRREAGHPSVPSIPWRLAPAAAGID